MKLLILTQAVDENNPVLGFFIDWIKEFAKHCDGVVVICLYRGKYDLPANIRVLSLGKEESVSRAKYLFRFYQYIWQERNNYDAIFVHMNPQYIVLGGFFWKLWHKDILLWYNHQRGGLVASLASWFSDYIFFTSPFSYLAKNKKAQRMGAGINVKIFKNDMSFASRQNEVLFLGRISPVKRVEVLLSAAKRLASEKINFIMQIYGEPGDDKDMEYFLKIKKEYQELENAGLVKFNKKVLSNLVPAIYNRYKVFVNLTNDGSFDKTILEAMACGCLVIVSNQSYRNIISEELIFRYGDADNLATKIKNALAIKIEDAEKIIKNNIDFVLKEHDMGKLISELLARTQK